MKGEANALTNQIIDYIYRNGGFSWRASSQGTFDASAGKWRTGAKKGVSDVLACYKGRLLAIEVKIGKDKLSNEQQGFLANVEACGGITYVAKYFDDFKFWFDREKLLIDNSFN